MKIESNDLYFKIVKFDCVIIIGRKNHFLKFNISLPKPDKFVNINDCDLILPFDCTSSLLVLPNYSNYLQFYSEWHYGLQACSHPSLDIKGCFDDFHLQSYYKDVPFQLPITQRQFLAFGIYRPKSDKVKKKRSSCRKLFRLRLYRIHQRIRLNHQHLVASTLLHRKYMLGPLHLCTQLILNFLLCSCMGMHPILMVSLLCQKFGLNLS